MTGAGHSKNVFSTPAGFSSRRQRHTVCHISSSYFVLTTLSRGEHAGLYTENDPNTLQTDIKILLRTWNTLRKKPSVGVLTDCNGIVDFEAAEHLVDVPGMEKTVSSHHHLERFWLHNTHWHFFILGSPCQAKLHFIVYVLYMRLSFMFNTAQLHFTPSMVRKGSI